MNYQVERMRNWKPGASVTSSGSGHRLAAPAALAAALLLILVVALNGFGVAVGVILPVVILDLLFVGGLLFLWPQAEGPSRREDRAQACIEDQTEFVVRWKPDGTRSLVNDAYRRFVGRPAAALSDAGFFDEVHEEEREDLRRTIGELTPEDPCVVEEHRVLSSQGEVRWSGWSHRGIFDDSGRLMELRSVGRDITRRKNAEAALRLSEERYRTFYRKTPVMLHSAEENNGALLSASDHWLKTLGYERDEVVGRSSLSFMDEGSRRFVEEVCEPKLEREGFLKDESVRFEKKSGQTIDALLSAIGERDESGRIARTLAVSIDVTERNRAERQRQRAFEEIARLKEELERERDYLREEVKVSSDFGEIVGESLALKRVLAKVEAVAATDSSVLISGESGVGKELVARATYSQSSRSARPLVKVNCVSIPRELFESEFFGHIKGSFTGAHRDRVGRFQLADGGTLFLDEVSEIPFELQGKLLRVLEEGEFERVGEDLTRKVDVRIIAATNRDLETEVKEGRFREDLYYRLSVFPIEVPPLRERWQDIAPLATYFLELVSRDLGREVLSLNRFQAEVLAGYDWPGNIRELRNVIERAVISSCNGRLRLDLALPDGLQSQGESKTLPSPAPNGKFMTSDELKQLQKSNIVAALEHSGWRVSGQEGAATLLGLKPSTLTYQMKALGIRKSA